MRARGAWVLAVSAGWMVGLAGCKLRGPVDYTPPTPTGIIFLQAPPAQLAVNARVTLEASMTDANGPLGSIFDTPISWNASCGSTTACGSFDQSDELGAVTYTAPATIPKGGTVTVTATGAGLSVSATVTIVPPLPIGVAFDGTPPASLVTGATFKLAAEITNDTSASPEVTWSAACGAADCGSFSPATTENEDETTYTAPAAIPAGGTVTLKASSVADPTKTASAKVAITAAGATLANGTYVFQIAVTPGYDTGFVTGVLVAANGTISGGEQDVANYSGTATTNAYTATQKITGGSYGLTSDGNLVVKVEVGANETETLEGRLSADGHTVVAGLDGAPASGTLDLQTSTAGMAGGYAVSLSGGDELYEAAWIAGVINIDGAGTISGAGSVLDAIDPGQNAAGELKLQPSTVSAPDQYGRVVIRLFSSTLSSFHPLYLAGYMVDGTRMLLVETGDTTDTTNFQGVMGGTALAQGTNTGQYSAATLVGRVMYLAEKVLMGMAS